VIWDPEIKPGAANTPDATNSGSKLPIRCHHLLYDHLEVTVRHPVVFAWPISVSSRHRTIDAIITGT
jgi:hypothetical protein